MGMVTVRNLDDEVKARLRERAARHGRSMEAEIRDVLTRAVADDDESRSVADVFLHGFGGDPLDLELPVRSSEQHRPVDL